MPQAQNSSYRYLKNKHICAVKVKETWRDKMVNSNENILISYMHLFWVWLSNIIQDFLYKPVFLTTFTWGNLVQAANVFNPLNLRNIFFLYPRNRIKRKRLNYLPSKLPILLQRKPLHSRHVIYWKKSFCWDKYRFVGKT